MPSPVSPTLAYQCPRCRERAEAHARKAFVRLAGFTLTELLVSITVTGILALLLVPVVTNVIQSSRNAQCQSNLRQIGIAIMVYAGDHGGLLPDSYNAEQNRSWRNLLNDEGYLSTEQNNSVFVCSAAVSMYGNLVRKSPPPTCYSLNAFVGSSYGNGNLEKLNTLESPSEVILASDGVFRPSGGYWSSTRWPGDPWEKVHEEGVNILFFDTHVEYRASEDLPQGPINNPDKALFWLGNKTARN